MAFYTGIDCPVCGNPFQDGEDIVTCPQCGTPSHRSCYESIGHCANAEKHKEGFTFDLDKHRKKEGPAVSGSVDAAPVALERPVPAAAPQQAMPLFGMPAIPLVDPYKGSSEKISGEKISDVAAVVRTNTPFYLRAFKKMEHKNRKISWNWSAFFFGPYWCFFRRMSKLGVVFLSVQLIAQIVIQAVFSSQLTQFYALIEGAFTAETLNSPFFYTNMEHIQKVMELARQSGAVLYFIIFFITTIIIRLVCALMANSFYQKHCIGIIKKVRIQIENPEFIERFTAAGYAVKTKTELLRMYLAQLGGTSVFSLLTGYMGYTLVTMLLNYVL